MRRKKPPSELGFKQLILGENPADDVTPSTPPPTPTPTKTSTPKPSKVEYIRQRERELIESGLTHEQALDIIMHELDQQEDGTR